MQNCDQIISADWVVQGGAGDTAMADAGIAITAGNIIAVAERAKLDENYAAQTHLHLDGHVLMPGRVNAHTHSAMSLMRGYADDLPLMAWLTEYIWPLEAKHVNEDFVRVGSLLACAEMIRGGTTCFGDMYFYPEITADVVSEVGMRATIGLIMLDFPTAYAGGPDEYLQKGLALHDDLRHNPMIKTAFAPHAPYTVSDNPLRKMGTLANELEIPVHIHLHETASEIEQALAQHGHRPLTRLQRLGLASPRLLAVHMTQLLDQEIDFVAESGINVFHCPESNLKLASGFCPVHQLRDAGVNIAIGTDGAASNNDLDMFGETRSAALLAKGISADAAAVPAGAAIAMAGVNGAAALGHEQVGLLQAGYAADVVAVDATAIEFQPLFDPVSALVYHLGRQCVRHVWINGKQLLNDRRLVTIDETELNEQVQRIGNILRRDR
jgi:5-methylthioadenosine/S-adenosylhomocysteine deaminase